MKAKISFIDGNKYIVIENHNINFEEFCEDLFKRKIYLSKATKGIFSVAIHTDNILFVEEVEN